MDKWPQQFVNKEVRRLVDVVDGQQKLIEQLSAEIELLKETKADRRGRKPTAGRTAG